jgi:RNA polymerase sigma-70 factor (ECF subfamily)
MERLPKGTYRPTGRGRTDKLSDPAGIRRQTDAPSLDSELGMRAAYDAFGGELYRMAYRALNDDTLAEEAVQETFLRAWRASDRHDPRRSSLRTWLFAIARNVTIDLARARSARPQSAGQEAEERTQAAQDSAEESLRGWEIEEALRLIGAHHRYAIVETYYRDRPCAEVAAEVGVPVGTMRSRLYYGLKALRGVLEERGWSG